MKSSKIPTVPPHPAFSDPDWFLPGQLVKATVVSDGDHSVVVPAGTAVFVGANDFGDSQRVFLCKNTSFMASVPRHEIVPEGADDSWWDR